MGALFSSESGEYATKENLASVKTVVNTLKHNVNNIKGHNSASVNNNNPTAPTNNNGNNGNNRNNNGNNNNPQAVNNNQRYAALKVNANQANKLAQVTQGTSVAPAAATAAVVANAAVAANKPNASKTQVKAATANVAVNTQQAIQQLEQVAATSLPPAEQNAAKQVAATVNGANLLLQPASSEPLLTEQNKAVAAAANEIQGASTNTGSYVPPPVTPIAVNENLFKGLSVEGKPTVGGNKNRKGRAHSRSRRNRK
jgi:hypothetical protein